MKLPKKYTEEGELITTVVTCRTCNYVTYDEVPDVCPKCGLTVVYEGVK